jgi:hypothetical protein
MMNSNTKLILILVLVVALVIFGPIITIWSLNVLFPSLAIPITFETWCAVVILGAAIRGDGIVSLKGKK